MSNMSDYDITVRNAYMEGKHEGEEIGHAETKKEIEDKVLDTLLRIECHKDYGHDWSIIQKEFSWIGGK